MASWKRDFASGLIILVPILVTAVVLVWIYNRLRLVPLPIESGPIRVALSLLIFVLLVFSVGYLMRTALGAVLETALDDLMNSLPGLRVIYNASKMAVETALSGASDLQEPVRIEMWGGLRMTAFKTGNETPDGREILFLPTAPNITTGYVIEVEPDRYTEVEDNVEDALTRLISAGFGNNNDDSLVGLFEDEETIQGDGEVAADEVDETLPADDDGTSQSANTAEDASQSVDAAEE
jgi:uncharacterized membrane protein